ncbi:MAG TPA: VOC family protein [Vicinamibacterales bacterium]
MPAAPATAPDITGRFVWYELMTTDVEKAAAFYTKALGWGLRNWEGPMDYRLWLRGDTPVGGLMALTDEMRATGVPPSWLAYVGTADVDATLTKATELGAKTLVPPMDVPGVGRMAVLADPQGAAFAIYKPAGPEQPDAEPQPLDFSWHELATTDEKAAFGFYSNLFGWEQKEAMDMGELGTYRMFGRPGGRMYGGMFNIGTEMKMPPNWGLYVMVDDLEAALERIKAGGGQVINGPMEVPGGDRIANCFDPQGAYFSVHVKGPAQAQGTA